MIVTPRIPAFSALDCSKPIVAAVPAALISSTRLLAVTSSSTDDGEGSTLQLDLSPRARSVIYMASALILHFGGYEFMRNSCLALFTSTEFGFASSAAFPLATGLVSPFAVVLLWGYSRTLEADGPRGALRNTTLFCILFVMATVASIYLTHQANMLGIGRGIVGLAFLFQNCYQHMLYMQHWSFMSSIVSPDEGSRWFPTVAAYSSLVCSLLSGLIPFVVPRTGLLGLMLITAVFMTGSLLCGDRAYALSEEHGFYPDNTETNEDGDHGNRITKTVALFRRTPTLQALLGEVVAFQCLSTTLNVAFVRSLKESITDDIARSAFSGRFYSMINAISTAIQFTLLPFILKRFEQAVLWRTMPIWPLLFCVVLVSRSHLSLTLLASAFCITELMDYSFRTITNIMVYQPLDFEGRYLGKETIGLFGGRFGKSGMSLLLSGLTAAGLASLKQLCRMALAVSGLWLSATWWLASTIPSQAEAQKIVDERLQRDENEAGFEE